MTKPLTPHQVDEILRPNPKLFGMEVITDELMEQGTIEFRDKNGELFGKIINVDQAKFE